MMCTETIKICAVIILYIISVHKIILSTDDLTLKNAAVFSDIYEYSEKSSIPFTGQMT